MGRIIKFLLILAFLFRPSLSLSFKIFATDLEYYFYKKEKLIWNFKIKEFIQKDELSFEAKKIYIINKEKNLEIWADNGFYDKKEDKFVLKNNVYLITLEHGEIKTSELTFFPQKNLILTDVEILVKKKDLVVKGRGLFYNINTGNFQIKEKAKVRLRF